MKVAFIDSVADIRGAQRFLLDLTGGLAARRWRQMTILGVPGFPVAGTASARRPHLEKCDPAVYNSRTPSRV